MVAPRCKWFDENGQRIANTPPCFVDCWYTHPTSANWPYAPRIEMGDPNHRSRGRGRGRGGGGRGSFGKTNDGNDSFSDWKFSSAGPSGSNLTVNTDTDMDVSAPWTTPASGGSDTGNAAGWGNSAGDTWTGAPAWGDTEAWGASTSATEPPNNDGTTSSPKWGESSAAWGETSTTKAPAEPALSAWPSSSRQPVSPHQPPIHSPAVSAASWSGGFDKSDAMQVDPTPPLSDKGKGKRRESYDGFSHSRNTSFDNFLSPSPSAAKAPAFFTHPSPPVERQRSPSPVFSDIIDESDLSNDPTRIYKRRIRLFLRLIKLKMDLENARQDFSHFNEEKAYPSVLMAINMLDDKIALHDKQLTDRIDALEKKIKQKEDALLALPTNTTHRISSAAFNANAESILTHLENVQEWMAEVSAVQNDVRAKIQARDAGESTAFAGHLPPLQPPSWPAHPSKAHLRRRFEIYEKHLRDIETHLEEFQWDNTEEYFENVVDLKKLRLDAEPEPLDPRDALIEAKILQYEEIIEKQFEASMKIVGEHQDAIKAEFEAARRDLNELLRLKKEVESKVNILEMKERERKESLQALSEQVRYRLTEPVPEKELVTELWGHASDQLEGVTPAVKELERYIDEATVQVATRVEKEIDVYVAPSLAKVKNLRARAHSMTYNGK